jgi:hypothetical protein
VVPIELVFATKRLAVRHGPAAVSVGLKAPNCIS